MEKNILMFCDTPFQVMLCIHFRRKILIKDYVDLVISDHMCNYREIVDSIKKEKLFCDVFTMKAYELDRHVGRFSPYKIKGGTSIRKCLTVIQRKKVLTDLVGRFNKYDEFWSTDILESTNLIYDCLKKKNKNLKMVFYEEGPVSVLCDQNNQFSKEYYANTGRLLKVLYKLLGFQTIYGNYTSAYSSVIELAEWKSYFPVFNIPPIDKTDKDYVEILNRIWNYKPNEVYKNKYIFFEETFSLNGISNTEETIIDDLCSCVGKENVVIKLHPRTRKNRFEKKNITIYEKSNVPWELIALNSTHNNNTLIAVSSGSLIHPQLYWGIKQNAICLVDCKEYSFQQLEKRYYREFSRVCNEKKIALLPHNADEFRAMLIASK